jgi:hypothetical protein
MFTAWGFLTGIFAVWLYAAIRPRYGAGPKTAITAVTPVALKLYPASIIATLLVVGLVEVIVGTLAGAKIYCEPGAEQSHRAATA